MLDSVFTKKKVAFAPLSILLPCLVWQLSLYCSWGLDSVASKYILKNDYLHITYLMETRFCYEKKLGGEMEKYIQWDNTSLFWVLVLKADTVILKNFLFSSWDFHIPGPLYQSTYWVTYGEAQRKLSEMLLFVQTVAFSLKNSKTQWTSCGWEDITVYWFCFQAVEMTLNSKLQMSSLIFCLANAWHLDETV